MNYNLLYRRETTADLHNQLLALQARYDKRNEAAKKLIKKHKTLVAKLEKLEWVATALSSVYALSIEDSGTAIAFQRQLFSDEELDLKTALAFVQEVKRHFDQTNKLYEALNDDV